MERIVVLGSGSWGTALSILLAKNGAHVILWGRDPEHMHSISKYRENRRYLPGTLLPEGVIATHSIPEKADLWVMAVPANALRRVAGLISQRSPLILSAVKGLETSTGLRPSQVLKEELAACQVCCLSGPNLAREVANGIPTATVVAAEQPTLAERIQAILMCRSFRVYMSQDIPGVELGGALKNVLALGAGMSDGLGFGDNTKGALLARGLKEMALFGEAYGAQRQTFFGISGVGDLFATAVSPLSRNYRVGRLLGEGKTLQEALNTVAQTAEGVTTASAVAQMAERANLEMPLMMTIHRVLQEEITPQTAVWALMERTPKWE
ncbi:MAG: NAD(P)H-dependent glycerol-3-phosphate dehydrogenase [Candidatus Methanosuratincola sp.]